MRHENMEAYISWKAALCQNKGEPNKDVPSTSQQPKNEASDGDLQLFDLPEEDEELFPDLSDIEDYLNFDDDDHDLTTFELLGLGEGERLESNDDCACEDTTFNSTAIDEVGLLSENHVSSPGIDILSSDSDSFDSDDDVSVSSSIVTASSDSTTETEEIDSSDELDCYLSSQALLDSSHGIDLELVSPLDFHEPLPDTSLCTPSNSRSVETGLLRFFSDEMNSMDDKCTGLTKSISRLIDVSKERRSMPTLNTCSEVGFNCTYRKRPGVENPAPAQEMSEEKLVKLPSFHHIKKRRLPGIFVEVTNADGSKGYAVEYETCVSNYDNHYGERQSPPNYQYSIDYNNGNNDYIIKPSPSPSPTLGSVSLKTSSQFPRQLIGQSLSPVQASKLFVEQQSVSPSGVLDQKLHSNLNPIPTLMFKETPKCYVEKLRSNSPVSDNSFIVNNGLRADQLFLHPGLSISEYSQTSPLQIQRPQLQQTFHLQFPSGEPVRHILTPRMEETIPSPLKQTQNFTLQPNCSVIINPVNISVQVREIDNCTFSPSVLTTSMNRNQTQHFIPTQQFNFFHQ